jgi:hypothetical protein
MTRSLAYPRRSLARLLMPLAVALMLMLQVQSASAGISWCRTDPLISVNGKTGHVYVDSTEAMFGSATGPVVVEVLVPKGTLLTASAVPLDNGFGYGYTITFREDSRLAVRGNYVEVRVRVYAPALDGSLPVRVWFHADDLTNNDTIKTSTANAWIETGTVRL